jgi:hypothetical protein
VSGVEAKGFFRFIALECQRLIDGWWGTFAMGGAIITVFAFSPLAHAVIGWIGAWWCYISIKKGNCGWGRLLVGFLCWTASFDALNVAMWNATVYCLRLGWPT